MRRRRARRICCVLRLSLSLAGLAGPLLLLLLLLPPSPLADGFQSSCGRSRAVEQQRRQGQLHQRNYSGCFLERRTRQRPRRQRRTLFLVARANGGDESGGDDDRFARKLRLPKQLVEAASAKLQWEEYQETSQRPVLQLSQILREEEQPAMKAETDGDTNGADDDAQGDRGEWGEGQRWATTKRGLKKLGLLSFLEDNDDDDDDDDGKDIYTALSDVGGAELLPLK